MLFKRAKIIGMALTCVGLVVSGCNCEGDPDQPDPQARLIISSGGGNILAADGNANLTLTLRATDANGDADNTAVDVTATGGRFEVINEVGTVGPDGLSFSATPTDGAVDVRFFCSPQTPEQVTISATNGNANGTFTVSCIEPPGTIVLEVDARDCEDLTASTDDSCLLFANLVLRGLDGSITPQAGVNLAFNVTDASPQQPEGATDPAVLVQTTPDGAGGFQLASTVGQEQVTAVTGAGGQAVIGVLGKDFDLIQTLTITISGIAANGTQVEQIVTVASDPFENETDLTVPSEISVATGETATISVSAIDHQGNPDTNGYVIASVDPDSGASLAGVEVDADGDLVDDGAGGTVAATGARVGVLLDPGTVAVTAPDVTELTNVVVTFRYQPVDSVPVFVDTTTVRVFPEGALILNAVASPQQIRSDDNDISNVSISVERLQGGSLQPVANADVTFEVNGSDIERIGFGTRAGAQAVAGELDISATAQTDANGDASITVSTTSDRVRGDASLKVIVNDTASGETAEATVTLTIDRDPRLQSIVFVSADPSVIGVRGGAFPSSSLLTFQVFDDENAPLQGASMDFDVNATADPEASVFAAIATTDAAGQATAVLAAGTQAGPISVVATATFNGQTLVVESLPVVVTGGLPSFGNSYIECAADQLVQEEPFTADCVAVLVDRFTNQGPAELGVHFRAEGGSITPTVATGGDGTATATFVSNGALASVASLLANNGGSWSYGAVVPHAGLQNDVVVGAIFDGAARDACYDGNSATPCQILEMCQEPGNEVFCPLPPDAAVPADGCFQHTNAYAITGDTKDANDELLSALATLQGTTPAEAATFLSTFDHNQVNLFNFFLDDDVNDPASTHEIVETIVNVYLANRNRCGFPTACLTDQPSGLDFLEFDGCSVAPGCMDFVTSTDCPQDGLRTIMAHVRGEEGFIDANGNGVFDFNDANNNNRHDPGEATFEEFIDMPEPFLDKNDNCAYDDLAGSPRLQTTDEIRHSDLFVDQDGSGDFGYLNPANPTGPRTLGNNQFDRDKDITLQTHLLSLRAQDVEYGEPCTNPGGQHTCSAGQGGTALCVETTPGVGLARGCIDNLGTVNPASTVSIGYRFVDTNGNCASVGLGADATADVTGNATISGDTEELLDADFCNVGGGRNGITPWCQNNAGLGSQTLFVSVATDCLDADGPEEIEVTLTHNTLGNTNLPFVFDCPPAP